GRPAGTLVSCGCGRTFGLPHPLQNIVTFHCPGCGAPNQPGDSRCRYCDGALKAVCCPNCFALMLDGTDQCGQCTTMVAAPALYVHRHGEQTLPCPRCAVAMTANLIGDHLFDRCDNCGGIWAHHMALSAVFAARKQAYSVARWLERVAMPQRPVTHTAPTRCPDCDQPLQRHQVRGRRVTLDSCTDHGVWFDYLELRNLVGRQERKRKRKPLRRNRVLALPDDIDDWWPFEAIEDLLEFVEDILDLD
ncbi:MAG: zf-TFIIB domain-containing protein, partial [Gammaproteobacteria bacterium]|nr:zf-TFIIB domain-containing protein [Gammaproteobacteria bacterium]